MEEEWIGERNGEGKGTRRKEEKKTVIRMKYMREQEKKKKENSKCGSCRGF